MPGFFFHISIELLTDVRSALRQADADQAQAAWPSGVQALLPFLSHGDPRSLRRDHRSTIDPRHRSPSPRSLTTTKANQSLHPSVTLPPLDDSQTKTAHDSTVYCNDNRLDEVFIEATDTYKTASRSNMMAANNDIGKGVGTSTSSLHTKGRYEPLDRQTTDSAWGIVHLYRDAQETRGLQGDTLLSNPSNPWYSRAPKDEDRVPCHPPAADAQCTMLCILAVPSYLAPSDFLGFVGEATREQVSHFRMIRTARANRYMVLIKFRDGKLARRWQREWNGKVFNSMEPETCHVVFVKSVEITITSPTSSRTFPDMRNDPFTAQPAHTSSTFGSTKPLAPRTPSLVELPTCPVCLERMDETTGLLTILCQHVFHCTCLQKWSGGGCPVCRYTHDDFSSRPRLWGKSGKKDSSGDHHQAEPVECEMCHTEANLWQCLICGHIGCGRYEGKHAFNHFEQTGHSFAMDMESKRVWDYSGDGYVHRIIQNSTDGHGGKLVELPGSRHATETALDPFGPNEADDQDDDVEEDEDEDDGIARAKMEGLSLEYTHLLTSQLESQRVYFEEQVERAADKAATATASASAALTTVENSARQLADLQTRHDALVTETMPTLQRDNARLSRRSDNFESMARKLEKEYRDEKAINGRLMERIDHLTDQVQGLRDAKAELEDQNRDLGFFISGSDRLREAGEEVQEGTVTVPVPDPAPKRKKGKGKAKAKEKEGEPS